MVPISPTRFLKLRLQSNHLLPFEQELPARIQVCAVLLSLLPFSEDRKSIFKSNADHSFNEAHKRGGRSLEETLHSGSNFTFLSQLP